jgi:hypothetical protein
VFSFSILGSLEAKNIIPLHLSIRLLKNTEDGEYFGAVGFGQRGNEEEKKNESVDDSESRENHKLW